MDGPTLTQASQVLNLLVEKNVSTYQLEKLLDSQLLADLLEVNPRRIDRLEFRQLIELSNPFYYGGRTERLNDQRADILLSDLLKQLTIDIAEYRAKEIEPVMSRASYAIARPIWYDDMGQAKNLLTDVKNYGWELADAFDAADYFNATRDAMEYKHTTLVAPATKCVPRHGNYWFAIDRSSSRAYWWDKDFLNTIHGNGIQYLLRKSLPF